MAVLCHRSSIVNFVKSLFIVITFVQGRQGHIKSLDTYSSGIELCQNVVQLAKNNTDINPNVTHYAAPCPCFEEQISDDLTFRKNENCYEQWVYIDKLKQKCCYSNDGNLRIGAPDGGYVLIEGKERETHFLHSQCCHNSSTDACELFYDIHPSDDCSSYIQPQTMTTIGDPIITTIDNTMYDFNGRGEYLFLNSSNGQIQIQTEYLEKNNTDMTIITAFVVQDGNTSVKIQLNRTSKELMVTYNKTYTCNASSNTQAPCDAILNWVIAGQNKVVVIPQVWKDVKALLISCVDLNNSLNYLNIDLTMEPRANYSNLQGLAGHTQNRSLICRNGTHCDMSSPKQIYNCGETWLLNASESRFGDNTSYNNTKTLPRFYENYLNNTILLVNVINDVKHQFYTVSQVDNICNVSNEIKNYCLLAIARCTDLNIGVAIFKDIEQIIHLNELKDRKSPVFESVMPKNVTLILRENSTYVLDLKKYATDGNKNKNLIYEVDTSINTSLYKLENGVFNWSITEEMRNVTNFYLTFIVRDTFNLTASSPLRINFCGCEHGRPECNVGDLNISNFPEGSFHQVRCQCDISAGGQYCERHVNPCDVITCDPQSTCDNMSKSASNPCAPCNSGYTGDGISCADIDECLTKNCSQNCANGPGNYTCFCYSGYKLNEDNATCDDIDECKTKTDKCDKSKHEKCKNIDGSYICPCKDKYYQNGTTCLSAIGQYTYVCQVKLPVQEKAVISDAATFVQNLTSQLAKLLVTSNGTFHLLKIINITFSNDKGDVEIVRLARDASRIPFYNVEYALFSEMQMSSSQVKDNITDLINAATTKAIQITVGSVQSAVSPDLFEVFNDSDNKICKSLIIPIGCDKTSTTCNDANGSYTCDCRPGFTKNDEDDIFCIDIDECGYSNISSMCVRGTCINTAGSWKCVCADSVYSRLKNITANTYYICAGDFQYINLITAGWNNNNNFNETELKAFFIKTISEEYVKQRVPDRKLSDLFMGIEIVELKIYLPSLPYIVNITYILHLSDPMPTTWISQRQPNLSELTIKSSVPLLVFGNISTLDETGFNVCNIPNKTNCDLLTTKCDVLNGSFYCKCLPGFQPSNNPAFCTDVDEYKNKDVYCGNRTCINNIGNWTCECDKNEVFKKTGSNSGICQDGCINATCATGSKCISWNDTVKYICVCDEKHIGANCDVIVELMDNTQSSKLKTTLISTGASLGGCVLILLAVVVVCFRNRRATGSKEANKISDATEPSVDYAKCLKLNGATKESITVSNDLFTGHLDDGQEGIDHTARDLRHDSWSFEARQESSRNSKPVNPSIKRHQNFDGENDPHIRQEHLSNAVTSLDTNRDFVYLYKGTSPLVKDLKQVLKNKVTGRRSPEPDYDIHDEEHFTQVKNQNKASAPRTSRKDMLYTGVDGHKRELYDRSYTILSERRAGKSEHSRTYF